MEGYFSMFPPPALTPTVAAATVASTQTPSWDCMNALLLGLLGEVRSWERMQAKHAFTMIPVTGAHCSYPRVGVGGCYAGLAEQFVTQVEPAFCGLVRATLSPHSFLRDLCECVDARE